MLEIFVKKHGDKDFEFMFIVQKNVRTVFNVHTEHGSYYQNDGNTCV
jgi:hypothetical protein